MIDYKFKTLSHLDDSSWIVEIGLYKGVISTEVERTSRGIEPITRYRRDSILGRRRFKVPAGNTFQDIQKKINKKLAVIALQRGETVIPVQSEVKNDSDILEL